MTKNNDKTSLGNLAFYKRPEEMQVKIDEYFDVVCQPEYIKDKDGELLLNKGEPIMRLNPPTVSGLALYLGFCDRSSMYNYKTNKLFSSTIKKAIARIESFAEKQLIESSKPVGAIFWLKNHGWKDKIEIDKPEDTTTVIVELLKSSNKIQEKKSKK